MDGISRGTRQGAQGRKKQISAARLQISRWRMADGQAGQVDPGRIMEILGGSCKELEFGDPSKVPFEAGR